MAKFDICPVCNMPVMLRKTGHIPRHGFKNYARNKTYLGFVMPNNYNMVETKSACPGSYKKPSDSTWKQ